MKYITIISAVLTMLLGCAAPVERVGSAAEALCAGGVVIKRGATDDATFIDSAVNQSSPDQTFGDVVTFNFGLYAGPGTERDSFLRADLSGVTLTSVSSATLTLIPGPVNKHNRPGTLRLRSLVSDWTASPGEDAITWNNQVADDGVSRATLAITGNEAAWSFDLTGHVNDVLAGPHGSCATAADCAAGEACVSSACAIPNNGWILDKSDASCVVDDDCAYPETCEGWVCSGYGASSQACSSESAGTAGCQVPALVLCP